MQPLFDDLPGGAVRGAAPFRMALTTGLPKRLVGVRARIAECEVESRGMIGTSAVTWAHSVAVVPRDAHFNQLIRHSAVLVRLKRV